MSDMGTDVMQQQEQMQKLWSTEFTAGAVLTSFGYGELTIRRAFFLREKERPTHKWPDFYAAYAAWDGIT